MGQNILIRPFESKDRADVRQIACDTALMGEPCERFFAGREVMADALTRYYTDCEPQSSFVAETDGQVVGYIIGSLDVKKAGTDFVQKVLGPLIGNSLRQGVLLKGRNIQFFLRLLLSVVRGEFSEPSFAAEYPAELHINVARGFRGQGLGERLIAAYEEYLIRSGISGVHFATFSDEAAEFFKSLGFFVLYQTKRSYFRHVIGRDVNLYIFGKSMIKSAPIVSPHAGRHGIAAE
jgi:predicted N-acetyltransferase YhbS